MGRSTAFPVVDLFCGAGGFTLGALQAGFEIVLKIDNDRILTSAHRVNFPSHDLWQRDLRRLHPADALRRCGLRPGGNWGLIGGPPCQGFSLIGKRALDDDRNRLTSIFFSFVADSNPAFFVMENVPGLVSGTAKKLLETAMSLLPSRLKVIGPMLLNSADYGAATSRVRAFIVGYDPSRMALLTAADFVASKRRAATVFEAIHDLPGALDRDDKRCSEGWTSYPRVPEEGPDGEYARRARSVPTERSIAGASVRVKLKAGLVSGILSTRHSPLVRNRFDRVTPGSADAVSRCPRLSWDDPAPTLRAGTGKDHGSYQSIRPIHPEEPRVITVREAARLQGFPDWFQFHTTKWHSFRMIGNSVSPFVARAVLSTIKRRLD
jgi:DNA (cytosine-5)-methyltransferase 1